MDQSVPKEIIVDEDPLKTWRKSLLQSVAAIVADPCMPEFQKKIGMWKFGDGIPYPNRNAFSILDNGCMTYSVNFGGYDVLFSVWLMVGEVRIGAKIPLVLVRDQPLKDKIARALDGQACARQERIGDAYLFDWIWSDKGWSDFGFMLASIAHPIEALVLADHISSMLTHLYLSISHHLMEGNHLSVIMHHIARQGATTWIVTETGDSSGFIEHASERGWTIIESKEEVKGRVHIILVQIGSLPVAGEVRTQDGSEFVIEKVEAHNPTAHTMAGC